MKLEKITRYSRLRYSAGQAYGSHRHTEFEINIIISGSLDVTYDDKIFSLSGGSLFFFDANVFHCNRALSDVDFISIHIKPEKPCSVPFSCSLSKTDLALTSILDDEMKNGISPASKCFLEGLLFRIAYKSTPPPLSENPDSTIYRNAVTYMNKNISSSLSLKELARHCGVCITTFKNSFSACTGKGAMTYFSELKMERAKLMLEKGFSVNQVSELLGFSSPSYFSYAFHRDTGVHAVDFKKKQKISVKLNT